MSKHTPGPWIGSGPSFGEPLPRYINSIMTDRDDEDEVIEICELPFHEYDDENEANALLIAAAPDLLEALKLADCLLSGANMNHSVVERKVRAAIAKATGAL